MILDGWGIASDPKVSAIDQANTPVMHALMAKYPHSKLNTSGMAVGLPEGQMGNSEVGHMNIGAGRIVYQMLARINKDVQEGHLIENPELLKAFDYAQANNKKVHLLGLLSDGGVHSHILHLQGLLDAAHAKGLKDVFVHAFTDGRDTDPEGGLQYITQLEEHIKKTTGKIASIIGRYYAMDRDNRWERVKLAYDLLVKGTGKHCTSALDGILSSYAAGVTDEFVHPIVVTDGNDKPVAMIEDGDVVIFFNFRTDRGRELTTVLSQHDIPAQGMHPLKDLYYVTFTRYDEAFNDVHVVYDNDNLTHTLGEVLEAHHKKQIRIAETEKYPHVTFFFSGGREEPFKGESRIMVPSPKVATYDLQPEMSAYEVKDKIVAELNKKEADFVCLNFANADMVGHTGVFSAAVKACETVDECVGEVVQAARLNGYDVIIIADHGNSDYMINADGTPNTAHTTNPVPCILVHADYKGGLKDGKLGDLAPTILELMGIEKPAEMTGVSLLTT